MISSPIRASLVVLTLTAFAASGCLLKKGSTEETSDSSETETTDETTGGSSSAAALAALVGNWTLACAPVANINGAAASRKTTIGFSAASNFTYIRNYYAGLSCSGSPIIWQATQGPVVVGAATTAPANGHLLRFTITGNPVLFSQSADAAAHLNGQCGQGALFNSNNSIGIGSSWICNSDNRFTMYGAPGIFDAAAVVSGNNLEMTSMSHNVPGVPNGNPVDSVTSFSFTK